MRRFLHFISKKAGLVKSAVVCVCVAKKRDSTLWQNGKDVYENAEKFSRKCGNYVEIHYTFQPNPRTTSETAVSTIAVIPMELQMAALNA